MEGGREGRPCQHHSTPPYSLLLQEGSRRREGGSRQHHPSPPLPAGGRTSSAPPHTPSFCRRVPRGGRHGGRASSAVGQQEWSSTADVLGRDTPAIIDLYGEHLRSSTLSHSLFSLLHSSSRPLLLLLFRSRKATPQPFAQQTTVLFWNPYCYISPLFPPPLPDAFSF